MRRFVLCLILCNFVLVFFSPFSIAITSLGDLFVLRFYGGPVLVLLFVALWYIL